MVEATLEDVEMSPGQDLNLKDMDVVSISSDELEEELGMDDICELLSPPRLTVRATSFGLQPGRSFDIFNDCDFSDAPGRVVPRL